MSFETTLSSFKGKEGKAFILFAFLTIFYIGIGKAERSETSDAVAEETFSSRFDLLESLVGVDCLLSSERNWLSLVPTLSFGFSFLVFSIRSLRRYSLVVTRFSERASWVVFFETGAGVIET